MAEQTQQGHARRRHRPPRQFLRIQPLALHLQGQSVVPQVVPQRRQLTVRADSLTVAGILVRVHPHVGVDGGLAPPLGDVAHRVHDAEQRPDMQASIQAGQPTPAVSGSSPTLCPWRPPSASSSWRGCTEATAEVSPIG